MTALKPAGYQWEQFTDPEQAVAAYAVQRHDLVITDLKMPGMNGLQVLQAIRLINPTAKVIICSGYGDAKTVTQALDYGACAFLDKPVDIVKVLQICGDLEKGIPKGEIKVKIAQIVTFSLGNEEYGIEISQVKEIIRVFPITMIPQTPHYVRGLLNLRGNVIPVVDLSRRLGLPDREEGKENRIIVVMVEDDVAGLVVDAVSEVMTVTDNLLQEAPVMVTSIGEKFIAKIIKTGDRLIIWLKLAGLLYN